MQECNNIDTPTRRVLKIKSHSDTIPSHTPKLIHPHSYTHTLRTRVTDINEQGP